jgi:hypothetical protein
MTEPTLDRHGERAARELAQGLDFVPRSILADPYAFAVRYVQWLITEHWRYIEPPLPIQQQLGRADPPNEEWRRAKEALTRKDHP